jgi:hypothetical protein
VRTHGDESKAADALTAGTGTVEIEVIAAFARGDEIKRAGDADGTAGTTEDRPATGADAPGTRTAAMAFGPGLTVEMGFLERI